jgi:hypothetical protein
MTKAAADVPAPNDAWVADREQLTARDPARRPRTICIRAMPENKRKTETAPVRAGDRETNASIAGRHQNREVDPQHGARVSTPPAEEQGRVSVGSQAAEGSLAAAAGMRSHNADQEAEG